MPNPLIRLGSAVQSRAADAKRPKPIDPVLEEVDGDNNPYRGLYTDHGVEPTDKPQINPDTFTVDVTGHAKPIAVYEKETPEPDPIPVKVVQSSGREYRRFWTDRLSVQNGTQVLGRDDQRVTARLVNIDPAKTIYVGSSNEDLAQRGYPLGPGKELTIAGEMPVWVSSADGTQLVGALGMYVETVVPER